MALSKVLTRPMRLSGLISRLGISPLQSIRSFHEDMVGSDEKPIENPFQISGPKTTHSVTKDDEFGHHVRYDMPGVDRKVRVMVGKDPRFGDQLDLLIISGWSVYDIREKNDEHLMQLILSLPPADYNFDHIKAKMKDGVLRVFVPFKVIPAASD
ncbi:small heat shock protein, chloroplastic-like protein [Corchorus capsularis]|uniref:Small heat shock protein, chloroplastic-like protein n=1 Tax=Corchorus capsularis TaxID=210143 RepID=A0A1R3GNH3_COCAP|nr:small heat shock protein, chloroplastic-like protein [Corchorus capsularis]